MKKLILTITMVSLTAATFAQSAKQETSYRRSSLYTIMLPDDKLEGDQKAIVTETFLNKAFPEKYNNHCLKERIIDLAALKNLKVSAEEISAAEAEANQGKSKAGGFAKKGLGFMKKLTSSSTSSETTSETPSGSVSDAEYIAKLQKYFTANHVAGSMVAKWFGGPETAPKKATPISTTLVEERGIKTLSTDELNKAKQKVGEKEKLVAAAEYDLMGRTFVTVNRYSYLSAEDIIAITSAAASAVGGGAIAAYGGAALSAVLKGYFVKTTTYLFQLDLNKDNINKLIEKYNSNIIGLYTNNDIKLKYVGKTWDYAPATMKISAKSAASDTLIAHATLRATDGAIAKLQKEYDQFKTLATLHQDGEKLFAFIGAKEGCKEGDKFEVLQKTLDDEGNEVIETVGQVKIQKGELWDNRPGAGKAIEGAATNKDKSGANASLTSSGLGTSKKLWEGSLLRQTK